MLLHAIVSIFVETKIPHILIIVVMAVFMLLYFAKSEEFRRMVHEELWKAA
nr:MAG TPA: hypothetical protein [Caudoviricetes sp.]